MTFPDSYLKVPFVMQGIENTIRPRQVRAGLHLQSRQCASSQRRESLSSEPGPRVDGTRFTHGLSCSVESLTEGHTGAFADQDAVSRGGRSFAQGRLTAARACTANEGCVQAVDENELRLERQGVEETCGYPSVSTQGFRDHAHRLAAHGGNDYIGLEPIEDASDSRADGKDMPALVRPRREMPIAVVVCCVGDRWVTVREDGRLNTVVDVRSLRLAYGLRQRLTR